MLEGKLIIIPTLGHQNKGKSSVTGSGLFVLMSQCGNNNELGLQHGGFCATWSLVAKGLLTSYRPNFDIWLRAEKLKLWSGCCNSTHPWGVAWSGTKFPWNELRNSIFYCVINIHPSWRKKFIAPKPHNSQSTNSCFWALASIRRRYKDRGSRKQTGNIKWQATSNESDITCLLCHLNQVVLYEWNLLQMDW